jgi:hypothetical protein
MKFLCVPCDKPMQLSAPPVPDRGSISLVYACPDCGYEFAMLTNPLETQLVSSLGVKIGAAEGTEAKPSKCPFTGMVRELPVEGAQVGAAFPWTDAAEARMANVPDFVKPMVRTGIERFAREKGYAAVDERVLDEAKQFFGM